MHAYSVHTSENRQAMLKAIGVSSMQELLAHIPQELLPKEGLSLPHKLSEWELQKHINDLAVKNTSCKNILNFIGNGTYEHYIPAVIDAILSRGEFLTSYTPYQPEMSQGLLQSLYEYQQIMKLITGMEIVNSSCYDGATALAEAAWMCCSITKAKQNIILVSENILQEYEEILNSYMEGRNVTLKTITSNPNTGLVDIADLEQGLVNKASGFLFATPNKFGILENIADITKLCKKHNTLSVLAYNPMLSGLFDTPGKLGVDVVVGNGQPLGLPMRAGGSSLGFFGVRKPHLKYVPGRIIGKVNDINGNPAYALIYEDREQHIARDNATSNICSNQALNALRILIYSVLVGEHGIADIASLNAQKAHYLADKLTKIPGVKLAKSASFFNEFCLEIPKPVIKVQTAMQQQGIFPGYDVSDKRNLLLVAVTEIKAKTELDKMAEIMKKVLS